MWQGNDADIGVRDKNKVEGAKPIKGFSVVWILLIINKKGPNQDKQKYRKSEHRKYAQSSKALYNR
jgi:hypothetical protein